MKGTVFIEFLEMTELRFGYKMADKIITESDLPSNGVYTAVGVYQEEELFTLIDSLSRLAEISKKEIMILLGEKLYQTFFSQNPEMCDVTRPFFERLEGYTYLQVGKLYHEPLKPRAEVHYSGKSALTITYFISDTTATLVEGIMVGCVKFCREKIGISKKQLEIIDKPSFTFILQKY